MRRILFLSLIIALLSSCGGNHGNYQELIGSQDRSVWNPTIPFGMVFIPQGSFVMGPSDQDVPFANVSTNQRVSVGAFYMDESEITNNEYRQFVEWVEDSIIRTKAGLFKTEGRRGEQLTNIKSKSSIKITEYPKEEVDYFKVTEDNAHYDLIEKDEYGDTTFYVYDKTQPTIETTKKLEIINWDKPIDKDVENTGHEFFVKDWVDGKEVLDKTKYVYVYEEINYRTLSDDRVNNPNTVDALSAKDFRDKYVISHQIEIYPNTLDFQGDYVYSHEETEAEFNFIHEVYDDYPVVGITWEQANAFCHWRTHVMNRFLKAHGEPLLPDFRLPTETEWEYAARGGLGLSPYPWGGPYTRNMKGCFLANFKPLRGNYSADGGHKAIEVKKYNPNNYGLYDMSGNVAEWTSTVFDETSSSYTNDMDGDNSNLSGNFNIDGEKGPIERKVIRGGSWKDIAYYIQTSTRDYEYANESTSYIGFRCVMDFLGRDIKDFK